MKKDWPNEKLDELCAKVGLTRCEKLPNVNKFLSPPEGAALWTGSYAQVMLWPVLEDSIDALRSAANLGQDWLDHSLIKSEAKLGVIDGYLILALPFAPPKTLQEEIWRLELSPQVCRKHIIWPDSNEAMERWARLVFVTVLGLPNGPESTSELSWPTLEGESSEVWQTVQSDGYKKAAEFTKMLS